MTIFILVKTFQIHENSSLKKLRYINPDKQGPNDAVPTDGANMSMLMKTDDIDYKQTSYTIYIYI